MIFICTLKLKKNNIWRKYSYYENYDYRFYSERNYTLFAILANVRNHWYIQPISYPKGLPSDCSKGILKIYEKEKLDAHSESFYCLDELLNFPWDDKKAFITDIVDAYDYKAILQNERVAPNNTTYISNPEYVTVPKMRKLIQQGNVPHNIRTRLSHSYTYTDLAENFLKKYIPKLEKLGYPEDVRVVFWFDN